jgi:hypothetical protein
LFRRLLYPQPTELCISQVTRSYPFKDLTDEDASQFYRRIAWLGTIEYSDQDFFVDIMPRTRRGAWAADGSLASHANVLGSARRPMKNGKDEVLRGEFEVQARRFVAEHGKEMLELIQRGVRARRLTWPVKASDEFTLSIENDYSTLAAAGELALWMAERQDPPVAIETILQVIAFARDLRQHPQLTLNRAGYDLEMEAMRRLVDRLNDRHRKSLSAAEIRRLFEALKTLPNFSDQSIPFMSLTVDLDFCRKLSKNACDFSGLRQAFWSLIGSELVTWRWMTIDRYRAATRSLPLSPPEEYFSKVERTIIQFNRSIDFPIEAQWESRRRHAHLVECLEADSMAQLLAIAASARIDRKRTGRWPTKLSDISSSVDALSIRSTIDLKDLVIELTANHWQVVYPPTGAQVRLDEAEEFSVH